MDVASYLAKQRAQLGKESKLVKDFSVFDFHHIPDEPFMRAESKTLIDEMLRFSITGIANHQAIIGSRGSGKTLVVKYLQRVIPENVDVEILYANCRHHNTSFKILAFLLGVMARGASMAELYDRFCQRCHKKTIVVLDEIDLMSAKDRRREILYLLSRAAQPFMVVMLSNSPNVFKELDAATRSSLQPVPIHFRNYDADQIQKILRDRACRGLRKWDEGVLAEIAALTTRLTNSDARLAIKTLQYSVTGRGKDVQACFERARHDLVIDMINDLSDATLLILWAVGTSRDGFAKDVYDRYCRISQRQREKPFSYVYFYSNLSYLQSIGLVALISTKQGRIYTNRAKPTFDPTVINDIANLRFEK